MNDQRKVIYELRRELMTAIDAKDMVEDIRLDLIDSTVDRHIPVGAYSDQWETHSLHEECARIFGLNLPIQAWAQEEGIAEVEIKNRMHKTVAEMMANKEALYGAELMRAAEKSIVLRILDNVWKDHLHSLDHLRQGINLRAYAQRNPLNEYKSEAFGMFEQMLENLYETVTSVICHLSFSGEYDADDVYEETLGANPNSEKLQFIHEATSDDENVPGGLPAAYSKDTPSPSDKKEKRRPARLKKDKTKDTVVPEDIRRNDPCSCGSGNRYKHCHGKDL